MATAGGLGRGAVAGRVSRNDAHGRAGPIESMKSGWPDTEGLVGRWAAIAERYPRPRVGESVSIPWRRVVGVVVQASPLRIRDGRGDEYEAAVFEVRFKR